VQYTLVKGLVATQLFHGWASRGCSVGWPGRPR